MYYINIILYGYPQLKLLNGTFLADLEERFCQIAQCSGGIWSATYPYQIMLPSKYKESAEILLETAFSIAKELSHSRDKQIGWSIIIMQSPPEVEKRLDYLINALEQDDRIWIDRRDFSIIQQYVESEEYGDLIEVGSIHPDSWIHHFVDMEWLFQASMQHLLKKNWYGILQRKFLLFYGEMGMGKRFTLEKILSEIDIFDDFSFASIDSYTQKYAELDPFLSLFSPAVLENVEKVILPEEKSIMEQLEGFLRFLRDPYVSHALDHGSDDLIRFMPIYLRAYKQYCYNHHLPCWILLFYTQYLHSANRPILESVLASAYELEIMIIAIEHQLIPFGYYEVEAYRIQEQYYYLKEISIYSMPDAMKVTPYEATLMQWLLEQGILIKDVQLTALLREVFMQLDELAKELLYYTMLADGMLDEKMLVDALHLDEQGKLLAYKRLGLLHQLRLINNFYHRPRLVHTSLHVELQIYAKSKQINYLDLFCQYLIQQDQEAKVNRWHLFLILEKNQAIDNALMVLHQYLQYLLDHRCLEIYYYISRKYFINQELSTEQMANLQIILQTMILRVQMLKHQSVHEELQRVPLEGDFEQNHFLMYHDLQYYRYKYRGDDQSHDLQVGLKKLAFAFQKKLEYRGEALSNYELAYHHFKQGKLRVAIEFCEIAQRLFSLHNYAYGEVVALTFHSTLLFAYGNLSGALEESQRGEVLARKVGNHYSWHVLRFLQTRIDMELGRYLPALQRLQEDEKIALFYNRLDIVRVLKNWIFRCYIHLGDKEKAFSYGRREKINLEIIYFYAEMHFIDNDYEKMASLLEESYNVGREIVASFSEDDRWLNGYQIIEGGRYTDTICLLRSLADEMRLYALSKCSDTSEIRQQRAIENLQNRCDLHETQIERSYNFILPYLYADSIKDIDCELSKIAINRALRIVMAWSNRITDRRMRDEYVQNNFWIKRMYLLR